MAPKINRNEVKTRAPSKGVKRASEMPQQRAPRPVLAKVDLPAIDIPVAKEDVSAAKKYANTWLENQTSANSHVYVLLHRGVPVILPNVPQVDVPSLVSQPVAYSHDDLVAALTDPRVFGCTNLEDLSVIEVAPMPDMVYRSVEQMLPHPERLLSAMEEHLNPVERHLLYRILDESKLSGVPSLNLR